MGVFRCVNDSVPNAGSPNDNTANGRQFGLALELRICHADPMFHCRPCRPLLILFVISGPAKILQEV